MSCDHTYDCNCNEIIEIIDVGVGVVEITDQVVIPSSEDITNIGTEGPIGPQGIQGPAGSAQGPQGLQGRVGPQGLQGVQGIFGTQGPAGTSITILGAYATETDLFSAHPTGTNGDGYIIDPYLYVWEGTTWVNVGIIRGPQGVQGTYGTQGVQGVQGATGQGGVPGVGFQGIQGYQGFNLLVSCLFKGLI